MKILRITEVDKVTDISADSILTVENCDDGIITVTLKPIKIRDATNPTLIVDYCQELQFMCVAFNEIVHGVEFIDV